MESTDKIKGWHAHIYFDNDEDRDKAKSFMDLATAELTEATVGDWRDEGRGPHTVANFMIEFMCDQFPTVVPWLSLNREGLSVLVHPMTGDAPNDHSTYAMWMGDPLEVRLDRFSGRHDSKFGL
ncbi:MAG TPA: 4,5-dioxygenase [Rhodospirillaceae bacterium]|nr:4,5-dioxygenase [Rhodospirillaceae bacterium]HAA90979.1 4,5-dioxygenase [Rhodospirillaceae bacterium]HAT36400.1 4,5-dioxygenase [Rhodospirillaceae bacterium]|tara:strand:+ start:452 stop:823 length:372 start_codon:yes stop_codon:yes gene_type:complete